MVYKMTPIQNKHSYTQNGNRLTNLTLDPFCFMLNTFAMGDVIASVPVVKYMIENHYTQPDSYYVVAKNHFRPLFPFVPDENFRDFDKKDNFWNIPSGIAIGSINQKKQVGITRNTPKHMHLSVFASLMLADRILPMQQLNYVPLDVVDVDRFNVDFSKSVILVTSYRDVTRMWQPEYILTLAKWIKSVGYTPVFIGKTDMDLHVREGVIPKTSLPNDVSEYGVDLRNQTSIPELASIFRRAKAVCGLDSGPIHLAGTTSVPIVCGYTSVSPEHRIPIRIDGKTYPIAPEIECIGCESRWRSNFWNYENCYYGHANCCRAMTPDRFVSVLASIL
jgi:hypothetical protein